MTKVVVMGSCIDIDVDADLATTEAAVRTFLIGRGRFQIDSNKCDNVVVTPLRGECVNTRELGTKMRDHLLEQFTDQPVLT